MRQLLVKSVLGASLLMGIAVLGFGSTQDDNQLLGRAVDSTEASAVLGTACYYLKSVTCSGCAGTKSSCATTTVFEESSSGGCAAGCDSNLLGAVCAGT